MRCNPTPAFLLGALSLLAGCGDAARLTVAEATGPTPVLPPLLPSVQFAPAIGWAPDAAPAPAAGLAVQPIAMELSHPRWLLVLPNRDAVHLHQAAPLQN